MSRRKRRKKQAAASDDGDPSIAQQMIDASLSRAIGEEVPDYMLDMLDAVEGKP